VKNLIRRIFKTERAVDANRVTQHMMSLWSPLEMLTPRSLSAALAQLRAGDLQAYARLWDDVQERDDILASVVPKRSKSVSRLSWEVIEREESAAAKRQCEIVESFLNTLTYTDVMDGDLSGGFSALIRGMMRAAGYGWSVQEIVWRPSPVNLSAQFIQVPLQFFERRTGRLRFLASEGAYTGIDLEDGGWLVTVCPDRLAIASLVLYLFKHTPLRDWLIYCHRYVVPGLHGKTNAKKGDDDWNDLHDTLAHFGQDWAMLTGKEVEIDTIDSSAKGELPYPKLVDRCDRRMTAIWRGADLSTMSADNATGASLQQGETDLLTSDDAEIVAGTLNARLIPYVLRYTLGDVPQLVDIEIQCPNPQTEQALKIDEALIGWGVEQSKADLRKRYGRPAPDDGDEIAAPVTHLQPLQVAHPNANAAGVRLAARDAFTALAADLQPLRARIEHALSLPDGEMEDALNAVTQESGALFRLIDDSGALPAVLARRAAQAFVDGIKHQEEDQDA